MSRNKEEIVRSMPEAEACRFIQKYLSPSAPSGMARVVREYSVVGRPYSPAREFGFQLDIKDIKNTSGC